MHKQAVFRLGAGALLVGLALAAILAIRSSALASGKSAPPPGSTSQQKYCEAYVNALASKLKVSVAHSQQPTRLRWKQPSNKPWPMEPLLRPRKAGS